jgi:uncharacterized UPF0160 family protein
LRYIILMCTIKLQSTNKPVDQATAGVESGKLLNVVTHSGMYHADDCMAIALMASWMRQGATMNLIRTRDKVLVDAADAAVDVGGEYAPERGRYDHHFSGSPTREDGSMFASAGLILEHFASGMKNSGHVLAFVRRVDAADTGTKVPGWRFSMALSKTNPLPGAPQEQYNQRFLEVVEILRNSVIPILEDWVYDNVEEAIEAATKAFEEHPSVLEWHQESEAEKERSALRITAAFARAKELNHYVVQLDQAEVAMHDTLGTAPDGLFYAVFPSVEGTVMVQQIPTQKGSFEGRLPLPVAWAGKRDQELAKITGVEDAVFCHPGRFVAGAASVNGAMRLAELAMAANIADALAGE